MKLSARPKSSVMSRIVKPTLAASMFFATSGCEPSEEIIEQPGGETTMPIAGEREGGYLGLAPNAGDDTASYPDLGLPAGGEPGIDFIGEAPEFDASVGALDAEPGGESVAGTDAGAVAGADEGGSEQEEDIGAGEPGE